MRVASVDIGTNSVRLLVAEGTYSTDSASGKNAGLSPPQALHEQVKLNRLQREMRVTRLGAGLEETGVISERSLLKTVEVLKEYCAIWQSYEVPDKNVTIFATAAARSAQNSADLLTQIQEACHVKPIIISGEHEARIGFIGATFEHPQPPNEPSQTQRIVLDIGGGSTEIIVGTPQTQRQVSLPIGVVRMTEYANSLHNGPPGPPFTQDMQDQLAKELDKHFLQAKADLSIPDGIQVIGVAGTVTTLAALKLGLDYYDPAAIHRTVITLQEAETILNQVWNMDAAAISALGGVEAGRGDIFPAGTLILTRFLQAVSSTTVCASESDSLDGQCVYTIMQGR